MHIVNVVTKQSYSGSQEALFSQATTPQGFVEISAQSFLAPKVTAIEWLDATHKKVTLADTRVLLEELLEEHAPIRQRYRVQGFAFPLSRLITHAQGEWLFSHNRVTWTYSFYANSLLAKLGVMLIAKLIFKPMMQKTLINLCAHAQPD